MLQEQLFNALPDQTKKYVWDRQVRTADETALEDDRWFQGTKLTENVHKYENKVRKPKFQAHSLLETKADIGLTETAVDRDSHHRGKSRCSCCTRFEQ